MSVSEDTELRDLVSQILEKNGILSKIRAELRANVFLALEEQSSENKPSFGKNPLKDYLSMSGSALGLCLVREFLEYLELDNTLAVFNTETHHGKEYEYKGRNNLSKDLHLEKFKDRKGPLLSSIIQIALESLGSSSMSSQRDEHEKQETEDFERNNLQLHTAHIPTNLSFTESSNASLDSSHNLLNQTFTTGAIIASFGSPDTSLEKQSTEAGFQTCQTKSQTGNEKKHQENKPLSGGSNDPISKDTVEMVELKKSFESGDGKTMGSKDKPANMYPSNPQTSLSDLPLLNDFKSSRNHGTEHKSLLNALISTEDPYEEDFSSESSGAGDRDSKEKTGRVQGKKENDSCPERASAKDVTSPVASVSEELEGDTNSGTEEVLNSAASADTLDSSISYADNNCADYMQDV